MDQETETGEAAGLVAMKSKVRDSGVALPASQRWKVGVKVAAPEPKVGVTMMYVPLLSGRRESVTVTVALWSM